MITTAKQAAQIVDNLNKEISMAKAKKDFPILMEIIEDRAKLGYSAVSLKNGISDYLNKMLVDAGFKVYFGAPPMTVMMFETTISW